VKISKEWTCEERLRAIEILARKVNKKPLWYRPLLGTIIIIATYEKEFLEVNRRQIEKDLANDNKA
jgi:hypothetical protein